MLRSLYDKFCKNLKKIAEVIGAIIVIVGALTGVYSWVSSQFANAVSDQISEFQEEMEESNRRQEQSITRVELIALMEHDPYNVAAIEKMAKYYFQDLDGDLYMTQHYSEWCKRYGGDPNIILGGNR